MKNYAHLFIAIAGIFSFNCFAQRNDGGSANVKLESTIVMSDRLSNNEPPVIAYHVEEKINMNFGSRICTYTVPNLSLVNTNDLGPNNNRVVTPKYAKARIAAVGNELSKATVQIASEPITKSIKIDSIISRQKAKYVNINKIDTYERVLNNGYQSLDMLKKVADKHFFDDDLVVSAKWYTQLFTMTTDLEPAYYYRYAQSLKAIGQTDKAKEMMALYESKK
jgi:hypothetical protein